MPPLEGRVNEGKAPRLGESGGSCERVGEVAPVGVGFLLFYWYWLIDQ